MIYLDYSATTPVSLEVQDTINKVTREFIGNANSINGLGIKSKNLLNSATKQIAEEFNILESEINPQIKPKSLVTQIVFILYVTYDWCLISVNFSNLSNKSGKYFLIIEYNSIIKFLSFLSSLLCFLFITTYHFFIM